MGPPWHATTATEVLQRVGSSPGGLTEIEAGHRLARHGPNVFRSSPSVSAWGILTSQFRSIITLLLVVAAGIALFTGDALDTLAIAAVLVLNVALGFTTELRANRAMEALLRLEVSRASVIRDGRLRSIDAADLVPGDLIELEAGQTVPADARLTRSAELQVAESSLTGESLPVDKVADSIVPAETALPDRRNMLYKTTSVVAGSGRAVVISTGMETEVGEIGALAETVEREASPLERRLDALGRRLVGIAIGRRRRRGRTRHRATANVGRAAPDGEVMSPRRALANLFAVAAAALAITLQFLSISVLSRVLGLTWLGLQDWLVVGGLACIPAVVGQSIKMLRTSSGTGAAD